MTTPLVEMDGDEMTRILWKMIKDELILPFVDLKTEYYDLGLPERDKTEDRITVEAAEATKRLGVAVKCATITPNAQRMTEYNLHKMWKSPNGTIRSILDGTVFRAPITLPSIKPAVRNWEKPITIARHAYGDVYKNVEIRANEPGTARLVFDGVNGQHEEVVVHEFKGPGVLQGQHNTDKSISSFAHACFKFAVDTRQDVWFSTKDTISKKYDARFREIFDEVFQQYKADFERLGLTYFYTLIDDAVARVIRSRGGFIWACKNYDGDVMSDMVSTAFGSLAMMTSVLVSPDGKYDAPLLKIPPGRGNLNEPHRHHLRLERCAEEAWRAGQPARSRPLRPGARSRLLRHAQRGHGDEGPGEPHGRPHPPRRQLRRLPRSHPPPPRSPAGITPRGAAEAQPAPHLFTSLTGHSASGATPFPGGCAFFHHLPD